MKKILFYGFNEKQFHKIQEFKDKLWTPFVISDFGTDNNKSFFESWRTFKFAKKVRESKISLREVNELLEMFSPGVILSCVNLESRIDNFNINDAILAVKLRIKVLLNLLYANKINLIILRTAPQHSSSLILTELGRIKNLPVYYFEDCTPTNSVHLLKYNNNALEINSSNKTESKDIKVEKFKLEDHVNENLSKLRKRSSTSNNFLLFLKTNQFIFKAQKELFRRALSYFIKSLSGLIRRKEFFLSTSGNYANKQNGFRFFLSLGISEFNLAFVILWYEYYAFFDWIKRDKNLDNDTILYLSNYQPERTTCPDSIGFNDPRQCINEIGMKNRVFYKEHPTNFLRYNKSLYRSGKFRSISFYKDMKNLSNHKIIFCPTTLNTEYVASISREVHAIASSFIPENRGFLYEPKIQKLAKVTCYTKNWYTYLENISSYDKKGINLEKGKLKFPEIYSKYNQTIRTEPGLDLKQNMKFREELIDLIAENIDKL